MLTSTLILPSPQEAVNTCLESCQVNGRRKLFYTTPGIVSIPSIFLPRCNGRRKFVLHYSWNCFYYILPRCNVRRKLFYTATGIVSIPSFLGVMAEGSCFTLLLQLFLFHLFSFLGVMAEGSCFTVFHSCDCFYSIYFPSSV